MSVGLGDVVTQAVDAAIEVFTSLIVELRSHTRIISDTHKVRPVLDWIKLPDTLIRTQFLNNVMCALSINIKVILHSLCNCSVVRATIG